MTAYPKYIQYHPLWGFSAGYWHEDERRSTCRSDSFDDILQQAHARYPGMFNAMDTVKLRAAAAKGVYTVLTVRGGKTYITRPDAGYYDEWDDYYFSDEDHQGDSG